MNNMKGTWGVITGASSGIGESFAKELAQKGINLILVARRLDRLEKLKEQLETKYAVKALCFQADITQKEACEGLFNFATSEGRNIQVLVNNAGRGYYGPFLDYDLEQHLQTIELNIVALTRLTYTFTRHMHDHGKQSFITNVASIGAYQSVPQFGVYCGTKKYVKDLTETLYHEFKNTNLHFCCISPGGTYTEFMDFSGQKLKKSAHSTMMTSDEVAQIAVRAMELRKHSEVTGFINKVITFMPRFVPSKLLMSITDRAFKTAVDYEKKLLN